MKICIIGYGAIGKMHEAIYTGVENTSIIKVDLRDFSDPEIYRDLMAIPAKVRDEIDLWDICVPTARHLELLKNILSLDPTASIILEKPLCPPQDLEGFVNTCLRDYPRANIYINDPYRHSQPVRLLATLIGKNRIRSIRIDFTKNRLPDEQAGRFVDREMGVVGYEYFHMLSILHAILGDHGFLALLNPHRRLPIGVTTKYGLLRDLSLSIDAGFSRPAISLTSSMVGELQSMEPHVLRALSSPATRALFSSQLIPFGSKARSRYVTVELANGHKYSVVFESAFGLAHVDQKNTHAIVGPFGDVWQMTDNHLARSVQNGLQADAHECHQQLLFAIAKQRFLDRIVEQARYVEKAANSSEEDRYARFS